MSDRAATPSGSDGGAAGTPPTTTANTPTTKKDVPTFTEREETIMKLAWLCLKSGPPEVDVAKLTEMGDFKTQKTCSNTWGGIKKKLMSMAPAEGEGHEAGAATPKLKAKAAPKKRAQKADGVEDTGSPAKKKTRTPAKKSNVKVEEDDVVEEE